MVGTGELLEASKKLVKDLGIENKVIFTGFKKNPYPYIKHAKLMVVSSDFEGFSIAILEALALGTPIISTDCPSGPREILPIKNLVEIGDIKSLAEKLRDARENSSVLELDRRFTYEYATQEYLKLI